MKRLFGKIRRKVPNIPKVWNFELQCPFLTASTPLVLDGLPKAGRLSSPQAQKTSNNPAAPIPPPTHMVTTTYFTPLLFPSINACPTKREPVMP